MKGLSKKTPCLSEDTYLCQLGSFLMVFNPASEKGVNVLNREAAFLYLLVDGKRNLDDIFRLAKKKDSDILFTDIQKIFQHFLTSEIIYLGPLKIPTFSRKPQSLGVWLHLTNQCNLRCSYCYLEKTTETMSRQTIERAIIRIFKSARKEGIREIEFKFSGGEALLEMDKILLAVKQAKKLSRKYKIQSDFVVLTNGVLLTEKIAKKLKEERIRAAVSLDGLEKYHNRVRKLINGKGTFAKTELGIKNLKKYQVPFNVSVTITGQNVKNLPALTGYLLKRKIPFVFNFFRENPYAEDDLENKNQKLVLYLKKAYKIIGQNPPKISLLNGLLDRVNLKSPGFYPCGMGRNYLVVRPDGKIASCQMTMEEPIGSIEDKDPIKTMQTKSFTKGITVDQKKPCHTCQWKYVCGGGCPLLANSPYCSVYKALIPEVLRLEAQRLISQKPVGYK